MEVGQRTRLRATILALGRHRNSSSQPADIESWKRRPGNGKVALRYSRGSPFAYPPELPL
ncbi:hypothetical protein K438DRAFT_1828423 [Mycena galopus ATCC 62051]|nr:hypothetical protein K438DRAFT_1828423 [Mycena galopus ATCC 62051]